MQEATQISKFIWRFLSCSNQMYLASFGPHPLQSAIWPSDAKDIEAATNKWHHSEYTNPPSSQFQELVSPGSVINGDVFELYLEYLCHSCMNVSYLRTFFYTQLIDKENFGWARAKHSFNNIISKCLLSFGWPLSTVPLIILPIYSRPYLHWTVLVQRIIGNKGYLFYADNLNIVQLEQELTHHLNSTGPNEIFFPKDATWIHW